jgi:hypothetical protein
MKFLKLDEVTVSKKERESLTDAMSNLPKTNDNLKDDDLFDLETVRKALKVELEGKKRPATIGRLLGRFKTLAGRAIDSEVYGG